MGSFKISLKIFGSSPESTVLTLYASRRSLNIERPVRAPANFFLILQLVPSQIQAIFQSCVKIIQTLSNSEDGSDLSPIDRGKFKRAKDLLNKYS